MMLWVFGTFFGLLLLARLLGADIQPSSSSFCRCDDGYDDDDDYDDD